MAAQGSQAIGGRIAQGAPARRSVATRRWRGADSTPVVSRHSNSPTEVLQRLGQGDAEAEERVFQLLYDELKQGAHIAFRGWQSDHTLQPTALIHEVYLRLAGHPTQWDNRRHFLAVAAKAMRQLLADHARQRRSAAQRSAKRGGDGRKVPLQTDHGADGTDEIGQVNVVDLDDAMTRLADLDEQQARVVELRFLAGLPVEEVAEALDMSERTVKRKWHVARSWLRRDLRRSAEG